MSGRGTPAPRMEVLGADQRRRSDDVGHDAVAAPEYSTLGTSTLEVVKWDYTPPLTTPPIVPLDHGRTCVLLPMCYL